MTTSLKKTEVLALDCQTTGANPNQGHLLEVAWCRATASGRPGKIHSQLLKLPAGASLPRRITAITGIGPAQLKSARPPGEVWSRLAAEFASGRPPAVIHFARFEMPFLTNLHWQCKGKSRFPISPVCTHEIAKRLFPGLPRRSLRALAGYFGHNAPQLKRAGDHVKATLAIWKELVKLLDQECGVTTLSQLESWLSEPPPSRSKKRSYPMSRERRLALPDHPGIYRFLDPKGQVLYVGKASSLKHRVNSYFQKQKGTEKNLEMLTRVREVEVHETGSALEAALLETDEIKKHRPMYNQALQEQDSRVWFSSTSFKSVSPRPGQRHPIGPLPTGQALSAVGHFHALLRGKELDSSRILDMPKVFCPPDSMFREGIRLFESGHDLDGQGPRALLALGHRLWREVREETGEEDNRSWTVAGVVRALQGTLIRAAHLVRRARWLCWLCEAELLFEARNGQERKLVIQRGKPVKKTRKASPRSFRNRQAVFDMATYDRLRVLTTELRRIVQRSRLTLRLTPQIELDQAALDKVLRWV